MGLRRVDARRLELAGSLQPSLRRMSKGVCSGSHTGPPGELPLGLGHQHVETADGRAPCGGGICEELGHRGVIDEIVDERAPESGVGHRADAVVRRGADRGGIDQEVPRPGLGRYRSRLALHQSSDRRCPLQRARGRRSPRPPSSTSAVATPRAAPPAPRTVARQPPRTIRPWRGARNPGTSVLIPLHPAESILMVLRAPTRWLSLSG